MKKFIKITCLITLVSLLLSSVSVNAGIDSKTNLNKIYIKNSLNTTITFCPPPVNWDPSKASEEMLNNYGLKPPKDPQKLQEWYNDVKNLKWIEPVLESQHKSNVSSIINVKSKMSSNYLTQLAVNVDNSIWAGYVKTGTSFEGAGINFTVPTVHGPTGSDNGLAIWTGLGGYNNAALFQAGILCNTNYGTPNYTVVWEMIGTNLNKNAQTVANFPIKPGDNIEVTVSDYNYLGALHETFTYYNWTTSIATNVWVNYLWSVENVGKSVEYIFERPSNFFGARTLADFTPEELHIWNNSYRLVGGSTTGFCDATDVIKLSMVSRPFVYAEPSVLNPGGTDPSSFRGYYVNALR